MNDDTDAQRRRDGIDSDVVMRGADAPGGEQIVIARAQDVDRFDNGGLIVGDDAHLGQPDALNIEPCGDLRHIPVLGTPRQNFIADDDQGGGPGAVGIRHGAVIAVPARPA